MQVTIEKMIYGGEGLARPAQGKAIFVPFVLPGEEADVQPTEEKPGFIRAELKEVLTPSPRRITPGCPYFARCGGCHYQHASYEDQLAFKRQIVMETLQRGAKFTPENIEVHSGPEWKYRNRTRMHVRATGDFHMGYFRHGSHELLDVEQCPISSPLISRAITALWTAGCARHVPAQISGVEFFADAADAHLLLEFFSVEQVAAQRMQKLYDALQQQLPALLGATLFEQRGPLDLKLVWSAGAKVLAYECAGNRYHVRAGSFFQVNRFLAEKLVQLVTEGEQGESAVDLFAGTGLFSLPLAKRFSRVVAVEVAPFSFADLRSNVPEGVACLRATAEQWLARAQGKQPAIDLVVLDPPRAGLGARAAKQLAAISPQRITYVSCDPATLARDLRVLLDAGYKASEFHMIDLFPQSFHIESVVKLHR